MKNIERIKEFIETEWDPNYAYTSKDISKVLNCNIRLARYYLMEMVERGVLRQIKYRGKTWYVLYDQAEPFRQFKTIGVTIR